VTDRLVGAEIVAKCWKIGLSSSVMLEFESINLAFRLARIARLRRLDNVLVTGNVRFAPCCRTCAESENGNKYNEMVWF